MQDTEILERLVENEQRSKSNIKINNECKRNSKRNESNERRPKQNE